MERWFANFKRDRTNTDDAQRSVSPIVVVTQESIGKNPQNDFGQPQSKVERDSPQPKDLKKRAA